MPDINKVFQTRIQLKYDTYANWSANNPILKAGEMAIATVAAGEQSMTNLPNVVLKVGDGVSHYNDLKFVSALAADVHEWAKANTKPVYDASEITGLQKFITDNSDFDTDTQYQLVAVSGATYKYQLQSRAFANGAWGEWANVDGQVIDFSGADTRLKSLEDTVDGLTGASGGIQGAINTAIQGLNSTKSQAAGADGLALEVVQENGLIKSISGSIAAGTYDAAGAAQGVKDELNPLIAAAQAQADKGVADAAAAKKAADDASAKVDNSIAGLDYTAYAAGEATGTTVSFVGTISETDGVISAEKRDLVFASAYNPETNKAATVADITTAVADLNGAMHYVGKEEKLPTDVSGYKAGDVIIVGIKEYVFDGTKFDELGDEGAIGAALAGLSGESTNTAGKTVSKVTQTNGVVTVEYQDISINGTQVQVPKADGTEGTETLNARLDAIKAGAASDVSALAQKVNANTAAIETLNGGIEVAGSVAKKIDTVVQTLKTPDVGVKGSGNGVNVTVKQAAGIVTDVTVSVDANTYDAYGAADAVLGKDSDAAGAATVHGANKAAAEAKAAADAASAKVDNAVNGLNGTVQATALSTTDGSFGVLTKVVEEAGVINQEKSAEIVLHKVAKSGKIDDLGQTAYIVFDCGSSSVNI